MTARVTIRPALAGEGALLAALGFAAWAGGAISTAGGDGTASHARVNAEFVAFCTSGWDTILAAEMDGKPVGWGSREERDNYIGDLWVAPAAQGLGVGRALLDVLETDIAKAGYDRAELETAAVNLGAIRFYERNGYTELWRRMTFSTGFDKEIMKVRLVKPLGPPKDRTTE